MTNPNLHAILIGIDHYSDQRNFHPLHFAEKDARDMQRVLIECGHFP